MLDTDFWVLGPLQALTDAGPLPVGGPKQRALLAELLLNRGTLVPRERLVDALWGERPPESAHSSLQVYVHGLRQALGRERITTVGTGYRVHLEPGELDVERFEELLAGAERAIGRDAPAAALDDVESALALWRGPPLADLRDQPFAAGAVPRLDELRLRALELRGDALLALGEPEAVLPELEQLIAEHPYRERLREQQIVALYRVGRQKDALDAYRAARSALVDELGVEPGPALQQLEQAVLRQDASLAPPAPVQPAPAVRLPAPGTPLVGRRLEIAAVEALLRDEARLVTLTGPGGTGKTRLALAVAERLAVELRDGACFVDLSAVTAAEDLLPAVARALAVPGEGDLLDHLRDRSLLLVLDNLEQIGQGTAPVAAVLEAAARVRVLATSRVPLRLSGEHDYPVPPLQVPAVAEERFEELVANEAVRLFAARARAVDPSFVLTSENLGSVVAVCRRLDGLPLALELAAAWAKVLPVEELERRLGRALDLLVQGARDRPRRQQTLRATLDWSYDLLNTRERQVLGELSVFAGDWTLEDAEAVIGGDAVLVLASLVEHSLVRRRGTRFSMLETIREYSVERLAESGTNGDVRRRHASYFVEVADRVRQAMVEAGEAETAAFALLDIEIDNVRATLDYLHETGEPELESRVAVALRWYWIVRGPATEAIRIFERIVPVSVDLPGPHADALSGAGIFNYRRGDRARATEQLEAARSIYDELGDEDEVGRCTSELGAIAVDDGDFARAAELFEEAVAAFEHSGNAYRLGVAVANLAAVATMRGRHEEAAEHTKRAIAMQRETNDRGGLGVSLANFGRAQLLTGTDDESARASLQEAFDLALELDYRMLIAHLLGDAARLAGDPEDSARLVGAAIGLFAQIDMAVTPEEVAGHEQTLEPVRAALGDERTEELLRQGRELPVDQMIDRARAII